MDESLVNSRAYDIFHPEIVTLSLQFWQLLLRINRIVSLILPAGEDAEL
jgi:hypothetical protein